MLEIRKANDGFVDYLIAGKLSDTDLRRYYDTLNRAYRKNGRVHLRVTALDFHGYASLRALLSVLRFEPGLLRKVRRYELQANQRWLRWVVRALSKVVFWIDIEVRPA